MIAGAVGTMMHTRGSRVMSHEFMISQHVHEMRRVLSSATCMLLLSSVLTPQLH